MKDFGAQENYRTSIRLKTRKEFHLEQGIPKIDPNEETCKILNLKGNERILDVGCGNGDFLIYLRDKGHKGELRGIDPSSGMISEAEKIGKSKEIKFELGNVEDLRFNDNYFDVIICKHVLYHFNSIEKGISEIDRVLKSKGYLIITLNSLKNSREKIEMLKIVISKSLRNKTFLDNNHRVNFENYYQFIKNFIILKELKLSRYINLKDKQPIINYSNSFREFWIPRPDDQEWAKALQEVEKELDKIIKLEGSFKENISWCGILLQKI